MTRLEEIGRRFDVPDAGVRALRAILALQAEDPTAFTSVRDPEVAADRHVADSLVALEVPGVRGARSVADLGSGAGWPGLALAAALPKAQVVLVESAVRHCRYLEKAVEAAGLANATIVNARAEDCEGTHHLVTARALAALPVVLEYAAPLLEHGGLVVAWKGAVEEPEARAGAAAAEILGMEPLEVRAVHPYAEAERTTLHVFRKAGPTPARFPRRAGMAVKRPLGRG